MHLKFCLAPIHAPKNPQGRFREIFFICVFLITYLLILPCSCIGSHADALAPMQMHWLPCISIGFHASALAPMQMHWLPCRCTDSKLASALAPLNLHSVPPMCKLRIASALASTQLRCLSYTLGNPECGSRPRSS